MRPTTNPKGQVGPKPQVGPPEPILAPNIKLPKNDQKEPQDPNWPFSTPGLWKLPEATSSSPSSLPFIQGKDSPSPRIKAWCIYGIIYHYAPILLRNPIKMFSGQNYAIPIQVPKSITHFEGSLFSHSVLKSLAAIRRSFKYPKHLALQELGCIFFSGLFQG
ncbi:hypothetical protein O181_027230 [Austropuccinia psidii MF-1]|uniref:Uncharacterized protein n=1 Tax=Austropuccinia psidii MF-1 TaxID=1389203 RepID=A0A9Q3CQR0_9BASI|nr:hypothetical protein [Austropuccinia psidii MF-1]